VEDIVVLGFALLAGGAAAVGGLIAYETVWKPRRRRRIERAHARSKLGQ
jgi:hypothetical protein